MSPWQLESVLDVPRNLHLKFHQNRVSNSWGIANIVLLMRKPGSLKFYLQLRKFPLHIVCLRYWNKVYFVNLRWKPTHWLVFMFLNFVLDILLKFWKFLSSGNKSKQLSLSDICFFALELSFVLKVNFAIQLPFAQRVICVTRGLCNKSLQLNFILPRKRIWNLKFTLHKITFYIKNHLTLKVHHALKVHFALLS